MPSLRVADPSLRSAQGRDDGRITGWVSYFAAVFPDAFRTPLEIRNTRPEWFPLIPLHADVISRSTVPSPSVSPIPTASNPNVSPGIRHVYVFKSFPSRPE